MCDGVSGHDANRTCHPPAKPTRGLMVRYQVLPSSVPWYRAIVVVEGG